MSLYWHQTAQQISESRAEGIIIIIAKHHFCTHKETKLMLKRKLVWVLLCFIFTRSSSVIDGQWKTKANSYNGP